MSTLKVKREQKCSVVKHAIEIISTQSTVLSFSVARKKLPKTLEIVFYRGKRAAKSSGNT